MEQLAKYYYKKMNIKLTDLRASRSSIVLDVFSNAYRDTTIHVCEQLEGKYSGTSLIMAPLGSQFWISSLDYLRCPHSEVHTCD